jgi:hypothetical protein
MVDNCSLIFAGSNGKNAKEVLAGRRISCVQEKDGSCVSEEIYSNVNLWAICVWLVASLMFFSCLIGSAFYLAACLRSGAAETISEKPGSDTLGDFVIVTTQPERSVTLQLDTVMPEVDKVLEV